MKAPDKIYLERSLSFPDKFHSHWYKEDVVGNGEEYIRKDTLLEWANDVKQGLIVEMGKYGVPNEQRIFAFQEFIDKLNSL